MEKIVLSKHVIHDKEFKKMQLVKIVQTTTVWALIEKAASNLYVMIDK